MISSISDSFNHSPKDSVVFIKLRHAVECDEELAISSVARLCFRHRRASRKLRRRASSRCAHRATFVWKVAKLTRHIGIRRIARAVVVRVVVLRKWITALNQPARALIR